MKGKLVITRGKDASLTLNLVAEEYGRELVFGIDPVSFLASCLSTNFLGILVKDALIQQYSRWRIAKKDYVLKNNSAEDDQWIIPPVK